MAVEIPVIVDIEGAFQEAAKNVNKAMTPLQDALSSKTLKLDIPGVGKLKDILKSTTISADELYEAMAHIKGQMELLNVAGGFTRGGMLTKEARQLTTAYAALEAKLKGGANAVEQAISGTKRLGQATRETTSAMRAQGPVLSSLLASFSAYVSVHSLFRFAKQIREVTGELEYQRVALGHLIQDEEYGARLFERIKQAAIESPFRIKDLVTYTKQLAAYRIETTQLFSTTKMLADVSAGLGVDMNRLILAYGQVRAASVLRGQELRQFTEAGIPLVDLLAEKFTELRGEMVSTADVFKLISERAVPFSMISEIFQDMTDVGGEFYQMQETQAKTLQGRWEKLKDTFDIALQSIGESKGLINFRNEFDLIYKILELVAKNLRVFPKLLAAATTGWIAYQLATMKARIEEERLARTKIKLTAAELRQIVTQNGVTKATKAYTKAIIAQRAATNALSRTFWKLTAAMIANPITAIITGVVALTTLFISFRKKTDDVTEGMQKLSEWTDTIERQGEVISKNKRMDQLINRYERLASKSKLTAKEQQSLSQTMRILQGQFKDVTLELNNANNSISNQATRLRNLNQKQKETAISTLQLTKAQIELRLTELGKQEQQQTEAWLAAARQKDALENIENSTRRQRRELKKTTKQYNEYGDALNQTSQEINTLENRLVSIENILNPQVDTTPADSTTDRIAKLRQAISDVTNAYKKFIELQEYESRSQALKDIGILFPSLDGWEPSFENMVKKFQAMLNQYSGDMDATRLIEQALANIRFDKIKQDFDDKLKEIEDDIKRSETARNFYKNILDLTGDENLAENLTVSVYGGIGKDFKDRLQEQLYRALTDLEPENIDKDLMSQIMGDLAIMDVDDIIANLDKLPPKVQAVFRKALDENQKFNADWVENILKTYQKTKTYEERITDIHNQEEQKRNEISEAENISDDQRASLIAASKKKEAEEIAKVQLEAMKDTYTWTKAFEDLDGVSSRTLDNLIELIDEYISKYGKDLEPNQLKELTRAREQAEAQKIQRNGYVGIADALKKLNSKERAFNIMQEHGGNTTEAINAFLDDQSHSLLQLAESYEAVMNEMNQYISGAKDLMAVFASDEDASFFGGQLDNLQKIMGGVGKAGLGIAQLASGIITPQAIMQTVTGLADIVSGIFTGINAAKLRRINRDIEHQQDLLDDLADDYNRLEKAMAKAFGSDYIYNYNKQLENLNAQVAAYNAQADLERQKGKKADQNKIEEYEKSARNAAEQIEEMTGKLAEYFSGTDLESAAKNFAQSWIEAYREFGSTTDAMKEKFQDMVENMVTQSLAAKVMQSILDPLFRQIDEMAASDQMLSAQEIADIANLAPEYIEQINAAMTGLMNQLGAAGYNMRQNIGGFTGISRDIAGASEESINGLAAGINTQNFYMSLISQNVAAILASMTGEQVQGSTGVSAPDPYKELIMDRVGTYLPSIDEKLAAIVNRLDSVIMPASYTPTKVLHTMMH